MRVESRPDGRLARDPTSVARPRGPPPETSDSGGSRARRATPTSPTPRPARGPRDRTRRAPGRARLMISPRTPRERFRSYPLYVPALPLALPGVTTHYFLDSTSAPTEVTSRWRYIKLNVSRLPSPLDYANLSTLFSIIHGQKTKTAHGGRTGRHFRPVLRSLAPCPWGNFPLGPLPTCTANRLAPGACSCS